MSQHIKWRVHRLRWRDRHEHQTGPWAHWWAGIDLGWCGLGVVRERWGWRIMLGTWHLCGHEKVQP
jgi:hypothetical protein